MANELWAGIPLLILIAGALITKRIMEPALISSVVAVAMLEGGNFVNGYVGKMYEVLSNPSYQLLVFVGLGFAGISALLEKSGAMLGFRRVMEKICRTRSQTIFFTWLLGGIVFIDDYLNALAVSASMKGISDEKRIPREHLAYTVNCMGACVCVLLPISSWAAFAVGCASEQNMGMTEYLQAIPFMFYPICAILISLLLAFGKFPRLGELKKAYRRGRRRRGSGRFPGGSRTGKGVCGCYAVQSPELSDTDGCAGGGNAGVWQQYCGRNSVCHSGNADPVCGTETYESGRVF